MREARVPPARRPAKATVEAVETVTTVLALVGAALLSVHLWASIEVRQVDDVYVTYTYARNLAEGSLFAYDARGIPSEGFTSPLYVLLLAAAHRLGGDMALAGVVASALQVPLLVLLLTTLLRRQRLVAGAGVPLVATLLFLQLATDPRIGAILGSGFEAMLGPLPVYAAALVFLELLHGRLAPTPATLGLLFGASFAACLVRPENAVLVAPLPLALVLLRPALRRRLLVACGVAALLVAALAAAKLAIFHDLFPTGFYRKVRSGGLPGLGYVADALAAYRPVLLRTATLLALAAALQAWLGKRRAHATDADRPRPGGLALVALLGLANALVCLKLEPLVGVHFRYLAVAIVSAHVLLAAAAVAVVARLEAGVTFLRERPGLLATTALGLLLAVVFPRRDVFRVPVGPLDLPARIALDRAANPYLDLAAELRRRMPRLEEVTVCLGDAGAFPYASRCRFVDWNGLTEPAIARLFRPGIPDRVDRFVAVLDRDPPDLLFVLGFDGGYEHGPLSGDETIDVLRRLAERGYGYAATWEAFPPGRPRDVRAVPWHLLVRRSSRFAEALTGAVRATVRDHRGVVLPDGVTVSHGARSVSFPPLP